MSTRLAGKVALITGAASGIGRACAEALAREGATVVLTDIQVAHGEEAASGITKKGGRASFLKQDVTSEPEWARIVERIQADYGRLDVLVNNAGIAIGGQASEMTYDDWKRQQLVNSDSVFLGTRASLPLIRKNGGGSIINMSSVAGLQGAADLSAYCASKGAVRLFTKAVAVECAALKDGVRVNSVHPGIIDTPIWSAFAEPGDNQAPDLGAMAADSVPMGVVGVPADIANAVVFLASDESRYMTGAEIVVDGGMTAGTL
jgi:NAD(P)-dependent dehydrogenase (short-subunit alcohol dehydrogenase family)